MRRSHIGKIARSAGRISAAMNQAQAIQARMAATAQTLYQTAYGQARKDADGNLLPLTQEEIAHSEARIRYFEQNEWNDHARLYRSWLARGVPVPYSPAEKRDLAARKRAHQLGKAEAAKQMASDAQAELEKLEGFLKGALQSYAPFDFLSLVEPPRMIQEPVIPAQAPRPDPAAYQFSPTFWESLAAKVLPMVRNRLDMQARAATDAFAAEKASWEAREDQRLEFVDRLKKAHAESLKQSAAEYEQSLLAAKELEAHAMARDPDALKQALDFAFYDQQNDYLVSWRSAYDPTSGKLTAELTLADVDILPAEVDFKYVKTRDEIAGKALSAKERQRIYGSFVAQGTLYGLYFLFSLGERLGKCIEIATLSSFVDTVNPQTGQQDHPCLISVTISSDAFETLNLAKLDPIACLKNLNARVSPNPHEMQAVKPIVSFDMVDSRFVQSSDVLGELDARPNLAELSPSEFEALMTNLFEKMGLETRLTRASRDGGVDCVAWDMRPIIGGKVVIQAKRYKNTVGVSAVRDLYGTMMNENASKGILVTTSSFGKASDEFANGKPIELVNGSNLLYLLREYAQVEAKIEFPEDWVDQSSDAI